jgi:hypothetical protein
MGKPKYTQTLSGVAVSGNLCSRSASIQNYCFLKLNCNLYQLCFGVFAGPDLPKATYAAAMVPTPDGTGVVMIGGVQTRKDLHELKCSSRSCTWMKLNKQLSVGRYWAVAMYVPDSFAVCEH